MSENNAEYGVSLKVITPEKVLVQEHDLEMVVLKYKSDSPTDEGEGEVGIMKNHAPMLVRIPVSPVRYKKKDGKIYYLAVSEGLVEVKNSCVTILSTGAERVSTKEDLEAAVKARQKAESWLEKADKVGKVEFDEKRAEAEVKKETIHMYKDQTKQ